MIKAVVKNNLGKTIQGRTFETQQDAEDWYEEADLADTTVIYVDISNQESDNLAVQKTLKDQDIGRQIIAKIKAINERKNLNFAGLQELMADENVQFIRALLQDGSVTTALYVIKNSAFSMFTEAEVQEITLYIEELGY
jgi:Trk K+ transport system NAD-binding subunit